jgi:hypothetical protein
VSVATDAREIVTGSAGEVHVFSLSGDEIYAPFSPDPNYTGDLSVALGDVRHEGRDDVITGDTASDVKIFSLADPTPLQLASFSAFDSAASIAPSLAAADTNGNGTAEVVAGDPPGAGGELRILYGFRDCPVQPDSWHAYGGQVYENTLPPYQFGISPGFDKIGKPEPGNTTHPRDLPLWREEILRMNASPAPWHMIYTFNEWGEGTAIESADEWASPSGYGAFLDALHQLR